MGIVLALGLGTLILFLASHSRNNIYKGDAETKYPNILPVEEDASLVDEINQEIMNIESKGSIPKEVDSTAVSFDELILKSPFKNVDDTSWEKFTKMNRIAALDTISPGYQLGMFYLGARALQDVGLMRNTRKENYNWRQVWKGDWIAPMTLEKFLNSAVDQYKAFVKLISILGNAIEKRYQGYLAPPDINDPKITTFANIGGPPTMSGLLAIAYRAGLGGLDSWLKNPSTRKADTTSVYKKYNGVF